MSLTIGIIGGKGSMGEWFRSFFSDNGIDTLVSDINTELSNTELAAKSDIVMISTPMREAVKICAEIGPFMREDQLLCDLCSQKEDIVNAMLGCCKSSVLGTHPMFGPFTASLKGHNIIFCRGRGGNHIDFLKNLFTDHGGVVAEIEAEIHDRHMAVAQSLTHVITISMGKTLKDMGLTPKKITEVSTPIFRINTDLIGRMFAQDLNLYASLVGDNKYFEETLEVFLGNLSLTSETLCNDRENRVGYLENIRDFFGDFCNKGLAESNEFLKTVVESSGK